MNTITVTTAIAILLQCLLMFMLGMVHARNIMTKKPDGIFYIDLENPNEETMRLQIDLAVEEIPKQNYLIFKVLKG